MIIIGLPRRMITIISARCPSISLMVTRTATISPILTGFVLFAFFNYLNYNFWGKAALIGWPFLYPLPKNNWFVIRNDFIDHTFFFILYNLANFVKIKTKFCNFYFYFYFWNSNNLFNICLFFKKIRNQYLN